MNEVNPDSSKSNFWSNLFELFITLKLFYGKYLTLHRARFKFGNNYNSIDCIILDRWRGLLAADSSRARHTVIARDRVAPNPTPHGGL